MRGWIWFCWLVTAIAAAVALLQLAVTFGSSLSAPQQAAGAAMACGLVVVPYVFTKAMEGLRSHHGAEADAPARVVRPADLQR